MSGQFRLRNMSRAGACPWGGAAPVFQDALWPQNSSPASAMRAVAKAPARRDGQALARRLRLDSGRLATRMNGS